MEFMHMIFVGKKCRHLCLVLTLGDRECQAGSVAMTANYKEKQWITSKLLILSDLWLLQLKSRPCNFFRTGPRTFLMFNQSQCKVD